MASHYGGSEIFDWLKVIHEKAHGNADLCAHFFRRAGQLLGKGGTAGFVATNTIAQGDTRATGLQYLSSQRSSIYDARSSFGWPGEAGILVTVVLFSVGTAANKATVRLDGLRVARINSRLRPRPERPDPVRLSSNLGLSFQGSVVLGDGFRLTPGEKEHLIALDSRNAERIEPYIGGSEVVTSPTQAFERYVINFGRLPLEDAAAWPDLLASLKERAKPERVRIPWGQGIAT